MEWTKHGSLLAAILYVVAVGAVLADRDPEMPIAVTNSLEMRPLVALARAVPPPADDGGRGEMDEIVTLLRDAIESVAHRPLASTQDRLRAAAAAMVLDARHLVPPLAGPAAGSDPAADAMVRWSFDPGFEANGDDLQAIRDAGLPPPLEDAAIATIARSDGLRPQREQALSGWRQAADGTRAQASLQFALFAGALVVGTILWFRMRRLQFESLGEIRPAPSVDALLPTVRVLVWFTATFLTLGVLGPGALAGAGLPGGPAATAVLLYFANAIAGIALIRYAGPAGGSLADRLGLRTLRPASIPGGIAWGAAGWAMLVPGVLSATILSAALLGIGGNPFDNPIAMLMVFSDDPTTLALLVGTATVLAPAFEEVFFRGFLHARLRRHLSPYGAAMASGLCFALAHVSLANLLPLWAIGFGLAILYVRSRTLWAPMIAHSLWNLGTAAAMLWYFR